MDKLKMHSVNKVDENVKKIGALFPNCVTERIVGYEDELLPDGSKKPILEYAIDFDILRQELSSVVVEGPAERYQFTWPDKRKSILLANAPIAKTLRPYRAESVDFDNTENLYIEGDNLDVLKLLQETYLGQIKMIYIDPPYNTGNDFVYNDDFVESTDEYLANSGQFDEQGNRLVANTESNGRFHTDWLNMIYPRLKLSKDLLKKDGLIFISIDDKEYGNLKKICDEIFGVQNCVGIILWKKKTNGNNMGYLPPVHDYILCYAKDVEAITDMGYPVTKEFLESRFSNPDNDPRGPWTTSDLSANHKGPYFPIENPTNGEIHYPPKGRYWVFNEKEVLKRIADGRIIFGKSGDGKPVQRVFAADRHFSKIRADSWWDSKGLNEDATKELTEIFGEAKLFTHPKPTKLLYHIIKICTEKSDIILDFFSGSATTAHAIMQLNYEDEGNRKYIMVQLPEETEEKSEAYKAGYKNICEIGKERIRRAGAKIKADSPLTTQNLDTGFRVLKLDSSNMNDVYYNPMDYTASLFDTLVDNIKSDRTEEDLLFQVMLDLGVLLSSKISESTIGGKRVFTVAPELDNFLMACFDENITEDVITEIAKQKPYYFVMRDSSLASDSVAANFDQIFATYSPETIRKVL